MAKKLSQMTWIEVEKEMSIAGSPAKITQLGKDIEALLGANVDTTNRAELSNAEFMLKRLVAEIKLMQRLYNNNHTIN